MAHLYKIDLNPVSLISSFLNGKKYSKIGLLTDENTLAHCYPLIKPGLPEHLVFTIKSGEENKNIETCMQVWGHLTEAEFDRHSLLIVLGGGVAGDLGGFCAATFKRGMDFVLIPTTLLAQVDASIGGKLGIDFQHYKNHIGVFCQPVITLISPSFLKTLPDRELRSGFAEVIKHCLLGDKKMWDEIRTKSLKDQDLLALVEHSVVFKESVTTEDPKENGKRKILNLGHTLGHALESHFLSSNNKLLHGEAIAIGLILESHIATQKGMLDLQSFEEVKSYIEALYKPFPKLPDSEEIIHLIRQDKKNRGDAILMALLSEVGKAVWDVVVTEEEIKNSFIYLS